MPQCHTAGEMPQHMAGAAMMMLNCAGRLIPVIAIRAGRIVRRSRHGVCVMPAHVVIGDWVVGAWVVTHLVHRQGVALRPVITHG